MKVKKYTASSMTEAMKYIREELGGEAVILSSKPVYTGGFLGLFRKRSIEVIAAIDPKPEPSQMVDKTEGEKRRQSHNRQQQILIPSKSDKKEHGRQTIC